PSNKNNTDSYYNHSPKKSDSLSSEEIILSPHNTNNNSYAEPAIKKSSPISETLNLYNIDSVTLRQTFDNDFLQSPQIPSEPSHFLMKTYPNAKKTNPFFHKSHFFNNNIPKNFNTNPYNQNNSPRSLHCPTNSLSNSQNPSTTNQKPFFNAFHIESIQNDSNSLDRNTPPLENILDSASSNNYTIPPIKNNPPLHNPAQHISAIPQPYFNSTNVNNVNFNNNTNISSFNSSSSSQDPAAFSSTNSDIKFSFPTLNSDNSESLVIPNQEPIFLNPNFNSNLANKKKSTPNAINVANSQSFKAHNSYHPNPTNTENSDLPHQKTIEISRAPSSDSAYIQKPSKQSVKSLGMLKLPEEYCKDIFSILTPKLCSLLGVFCHKIHTPLSIFLNPDYPKHSLYGCASYYSQVDDFMFQSLHRTQISNWPLNKNSLSADIFLGSQINLLQKRSNKISSDQNQPSYRELLFSKSKGLSLWALIISLTDKNCTPNSITISKTLCSYRFFCTSLDFLRLLIIRYLNCDIELKDPPNNSAPNPSNQSISDSSLYGLTDFNSAQASKVIQLRVLNFIKLWVKSYKEDFDECHFSKNLLLEFLSFIKSFKGKHDLANNIETRLNKDYVESPLYQSSFPRKSSVSSVRAKNDSIISNTLAIYTSELLSNNKRYSDHYESIFEPRNLKSSSVQPSALKKKHSLKHKFSLGNFNPYKQIDPQNRTSSPVDSSKKISKKISSSYLMSLFNSKQKRSSINSNELTRTESKDALLNDLPRLQPKRSLANSNDLKFPGKVNSKDLKFPEKANSNDLKFPEKANSNDLKFPGKDSTSSELPKKNLPANTDDLYYDASNFKNNRRTFNSQLSDDVSSRTSSALRSSDGSGLEYEMFNQEIFRNSSSAIFGSCKKKSFDFDPKASKITDFDPGFIAEQLTLIEHSMYSKISMNDIFKRLRSKSNKTKSFGSFSSYDQRAAGDKTEFDFNSSTGVDNSIAEKTQNSSDISSLAHWSNCTTYWTIYTILSEPNPIVRASIIVHISLVAYYCLAIRNYSGAFELVGGLTNSSINRLKDTWSFVPPQFKQIIDQIQEIWHSRPNHKLYRESFLAALNGTLGPDYGIAFDPSPYNFSETLSGKNKKPFKNASSGHSRNNSVSGVKTFFGIGSSNKDKSLSVSKPPEQSFSGINPNSFILNSNSPFSPSSDTYSKTPTNSFYQPPSGSDTTLYETDAINDIFVQASANSDNRNDKVLDQLFGTSFSSNKRESSENFKRALSVANIDYFHRAWLIRNPSEITNRRVSGNNNTFNLGSIAKGGKAKSKSLQPENFRKSATLHNGYEYNPKTNESQKYDVPLKSSKYNNSDTFSGQTFGPSYLHTPSNPGKDLEKDSSNNNESFKSGSKLAQYPVVPFFGLHLTDLIHADEANQTYIKTNNAENFSSLLEFKNNWSKLPNLESAQTLSAKSSFQNLNGDGQRLAFSKAEKAAMLKSSVSNSNMSVLAKPKGAPGPTIMNMTKFRIISNILAEIKQSQSLGFSFTPNITIQNWLKNIILNFEDLLNELSDQLESSKDSSSSGKRALSQQYLTKKSSKLKTQGQDLEDTFTITEENPLSGTTPKYDKKDYFNNLSNFPTSNSKVDDITPIFKMNDLSISTEPTDTICLNDLVYDKCSRKTLNNDYIFSSNYPDLELVSDLAFDSENSYRKLSDAANMRIDSKPIRKMKSQNAQDLLSSNRYGKSNKLSNSKSFSNILTIETKNQYPFPKSTPEILKPENLSNKASYNRKNSNAADLENILYSISKKLEP
ncbi:Ras guanine nucleotide exchange factor M, partial [Smittium culicis]